MSNSILLTRAKTAALLGVTAETISRYASELEGFPPQVRIGGRIFYRRADIDAWVEGLGTNA